MKYIIVFLLICFSALVIQFNSKKTEIVKENFNLDKMLKDTLLVNEYLENQINTSKKYAKKFDIDKNLAFNIYYVSKRNNVDPNLIFSMIRIESEFNKRALSNVGARGLMQVKPSTASDYGVKSYELYKTQQNLQAGINHLKWCLKTENNNVVKALEKYNKGNKFNTTNYADKVLRTASFSYLKDHNE